MVLAGLYEPQRRFCPGPRTILGGPACGGYKRHVWKVNLIPYPKLYFL